MKSVTLKDKGGGQYEIDNSICYRRNDTCSIECPFFEHDPSNSIGDIVILTCNTYQCILLVSGYV